MDKIPKDNDTISTNLYDQISEFQLQNNQKALNQTIAMMINQIPIQKHKKIINYSSNSTNSRKWSTKQTEYFFRLLQVFGTDFSMMSHHYQSRSKKQLLNKYKKQHKRNSNKVQKILNEGSQSTLFLKYEKLQVFQG